MENSTNNNIGDKMKKRILQLLIVILYLVMLTCCSPKSNELRLRIVASSNSDADQKLKLEVKDYIKDYFSKINLDEINLKLLEKELNEKFNNSTIKVERTKSNYEAKAYNGKIIQAGRYDTILITIGSGEGKNFWTLLYPEFFNISFEDDHEIEYHSYFYDLFN